MNNVLKSGMSVKLHITPLTTKAVKAKEVDIGITMTTMVWGTNEKSQTKGSADSDRILKKEPHVTKWEGCEAKLLIEERRPHAIEPRMECPGQSPTVETARQPLGGHPILFGCGIIRWSRG